MTCGNTRRIPRTPTTSPNLAENSEIGKARKFFDKLARQGSSKKKKQEGIGKTKRKIKKNRKEKKKNRKRSAQKSNHGMNTCTVAKICDPIASGKAVKIRKADLKAECLMH